MVADNWVPTGDPQPSSDERQSFREAAEERGLSIAALSNAPVPGPDGQAKYDVTFRSFADAYRFSCWAEDGETCLEVIGPKGFEALWIWTQTWLPLLKSGRAAEDGMYAVRIHYVEMVKLTQLLREGREDWDAFPGRLSTAWARWSR